MQRSWCYLYGGSRYELFHGVRHAKSSSKLVKLVKLHKFTLNVMVLNVGMDLMEEDSKAQSQVGICTHPLHFGVHCSSWMKPHPLVFNGGGECCAQR